MENGNKKKETRNRNCSNEKRKRREDAYYEKNQRFLNAIECGNIMTIEKFLQSDFTLDGLIFYRVDKHEYWNCRPLWEGKDNTPLKYALEIEQDKSALFLIQKGVQILEEIAGSLLQLGVLKNNVPLTEKLLERIILLVKEKK